MKRFTVPCEFGDTRHPFHVYIGTPGEGFHPLQWQAKWLLRERGGVVPDDVMGSFEKLLTISKENNVDFEDLCVYALGNAVEEESKKASD
jgi:hypothetical protein